MFNLEHCKEVIDQLDAPADLPRKRPLPGTHWTWEWMVPKAGMDGLEKSFFFFFSWEILTPDRQARGLFTMSTTTVPKTN